jgi:hypothetical protein
LGAFSGDLTLNFNPFALTGNAAASFLDNAFSGNSQLTIDQNEISFGSTGSITIPNSVTVFGSTVPIPLVGGLTLASGVAQLNYTNNGQANDDYILLGGSLPIIGFEGVRVGFDGSVSLDTTAPIEPQSTLPVAIGGAATISHGFLWSEDPDNTADQLTYTIIDKPAHGTILDNGVAAMSFTQADIDNGLVQYAENGDSATSDTFTFQVSDPAGNHTPTDPFNIAILNQAGPVVAADNTLAAPLGGSAGLNHFMLDSVALGNTPDQMIYQLMAAPEHGALLVSGVAFPLFTQSDIDNSRVQYVNNGDGATSDSFSFVAWDANAEWTGGSFNIAIQPNGATGNSAAPQTAAGGSDGSAWQGSVPDGYQIAGVGDFHGNGASDILLRNPTSGDVAELRSDKGMNFSDIGWAGPGWEIAGTTDLNGDGTTDIVFNFPGGGAAGAFIMNDGHPTWVALGSTTAA